MDEKPEIEFIKLPRNQELLDKYKDERYVKILKWFAQGYYNVEDKGNGVLQINNLRFGLMGFGLMKDLEDPYIFKFRVAMKDGKLEAWPLREDLEKIDVGEAFSVLWTRMWGGGKLKVES
jgi:inner membrane protein